MTVSPSRQPPRKGAEATNDVRQGEASGHMRWVLGGSLILIVAVFSSVYAFSALFGAHQ